MKLLIALILVASFLTSPSTTAQTSATSTTIVDNLADMRWLKAANPETYYREDIAKRQFRFFEVLGYSSEIHEVGKLNYSRCYAAKIRLDRIDGTTDMPRSLEHGELNNKASVFAQAYNKLMKNYADSHGLSNCRAELIGTKPWIQSRITCGAKAKTRDWLVMTMQGQLLL